MIRKINWLHLAYAGIFSVAAVGQSEEFFFPLSTISAYYQILIAFNSAYYWLYAAGAIKQILTLVSLIPLFLFIIHYSSFNRTFWQGLMIVRILFEIVGSHYEFKVFYSFASTDIQYGLFIIAYYVTLILPSYIITFLYAQECDKTVQK